jgi:DNA-binding transcriptional ArsR family regulator
VAAAVSAVLIVSSGVLIACHAFVIIHEYVNDDMIVRLWQDGFMEQRLAEGQPPPVRTVDNVDALKAMADPTRLAILAALMKSRHDLPVMSVKELAAELGEPQTKLYRHVRQLEAAGLIKVASTRMVSGILEQRYQACQQDLMLGRGFLQEHADESEVAVQAVLDHYRDGFFAAYRAYQASEGDVPAGELYRKPVLFMMSDLRVSPAKAAELVHKLEEITNDLNDEKTEDPDGVPLSLLIGCFVPAQP